MQGVADRLHRWIDTTEEMKSGIGQLFREAREELGRLTQQQLADALGVTNVYVSRIENGHAHPSVEVMESLQELLRNR